MLTERLGRLMARAQKDFDAYPGTYISSYDERLSCAQIAFDAYCATSGSPAAVQRSEFLRQFAALMPIAIRNDELIIGSQRFSGWTHRGEKLTSDLRDQMGFCSNHGHIAVDYGRVLRRGLGGLLQDIAASTPETSDERTETNRTAMTLAAEALSEFIRRHADTAHALAQTTHDPERQVELQQIAETCRQIATEPPCTFAGGLQLLWFTQVFLHAESGNTAISFGRFDQYMWPLLRNDLNTGVLNMKFAAEMLACFWLKCCEGDESQNLILGGIDSEGSLAENPLSLLCLEVAAEVRTFQPSLSVRICKNTSQQFREISLELCSAGIGMPSFFNDDVVIRSLQATGLPIDRARDFAIVGCYEAASQGDTYALTVAGKLPLVNVLADYVQQASAGTFDGFVAEFKTFIKDRYHECLKTYQDLLDTLAQNAASPFQAICLTGCIESLLTAEECGAKYTIFGVNVLGLGTVIDSLLVVQKLVYETGELSLEQLAAQLAENFSDERICQQCRNLSGKYGSDSETTNVIATDISGFVADMINASRMANGVRPYPGLFQFGADTDPDFHATPDGRRDGDRVSYGVAPDIYCSDITPTSIVSSAASIPHDRCGCGNPLMLSFSRADIEGPGGIMRLWRIIETYFAKGGFHLHMNITNADDLRTAQAQPQQHTDMKVRISGYSAQFTTLAKPWQDAIIERTEVGM